MSTSALVPVEEYLRTNVWIINPQTARAWVYTHTSIAEVKDGVLRTENPELAVPIAELFPR